MSASLDQTLPFPVAPFLLPPSLPLAYITGHWLIVFMAGSNTSTTYYALEKSLRGRFLSTFAYLAGRDLSLSTTLFKRFVDPVSPYEALSSWSFLVIAVFWLWMLASRLGMLAVIILVATAPWWPTLQIGRAHV